MVDHESTRRLYLWRFVRGDVPPDDFEQWVYGKPALEEDLGSSLYLEVISTNFAHKDAVWSLRNVLGRYLRSRPSPDCMCIRLRDLDVVDMGNYRVPSPAFEREREWSHDDVFDHLEEVRVRGAPRWWLCSARCRTCGQGWLVGQESRQNDVFCMRRLDTEEIRAIEREDRWPSDFDSYERLLQLGLDFGRSVRFVDPEESSLGATIVDLARARPGISVIELATLLNLDRALATRLARRALREDGVEIVFETDSTH